MWNEYIDIYFFLFVHLPPTLAPPPFFGAVEEEIWVSFPFSHSQDLHLFNVFYHVLLSCVCPVNS